MLKIARYVPTYNPAHRIENKNALSLCALVTAYPGVKQAVEVRVYDTGDTMSACVYLHAATWTRCGSARLSKKVRNFGLPDKTFGSVVFLALKNAGVTGIDKIIKDEFDLHDVVFDLAVALGYKRNDIDVLKDI